MIDLKANVLRIGDEAVEFLPEKDIPVRERNNQLTEKQIECAACPTFVSPLKF